MKYLSIDIETTGLDRQRDQILEFAAVLDDLENPRPLAELPVFHTYVLHDRYEGSAFALNMNQVALQRIATWEKSYTYTPIRLLTDTFKKWLEKTDPFDFTWNNPVKKFNVAGKNYLDFDKYFIDRIPHWHEYFAPERRVLDPAILYMTKSDKILPSLSECLKRAGFDGEVRHKAASDAFDVIKLIRKYFLEETKL